jgi:type IV fimbrial biogenesis protein FimT
MQKTTQTGFTLYELLTTMLIVGVVLAIGVPNMQSFRQNGRMTATANDLHSSFHLARSEAARAKTNITICASIDSMATNPTCGGEFEAGWVVFEDGNANITIDGGEPIIRRSPPVPVDIAIRTVCPGVCPDDYFMFASTGLGRRDIALSAPVSVMVMCDSRGNEIGGGGKSTARVVVVTPLGRAAVLADKAQVAAQGGC